MTKKVFISLLFIAFSLSGFTQNISRDTSEFPYWIEMMQDPKANFFETQKAFEIYWENRKRDKGDGWKPFKRWEYYMSQRVDEKGNKPAPDHVLKEYTSYFGLGNKSAVSLPDHWEEIGPINLPMNGTSQPNGLGRINCVAFHSTNSNILYAGAPSGGLWKSINGGQSWVGLTDSLPTLGVSSAVLDYSNGNTVYIGTGDRDGGDAPGLGVWKSTDGGESFSSSNSGMGNRVVGSLIMNPLDSMTLLAATNSGIYKSTDGAQSWSRKSSNSINYKQIVYKPGDTAVVYATATGDFYRSSDGGENWTKITSGLPGSTRLVIGVSPANSNYVYLCLANQRTFKGLYRSTNSGVSFSVRSTTPNIMDYSSTGSGTSGQAWYDLCIAVDRTNVDHVYVGGVNIFKSTNGGSTWSINAHWTGSGAPDIHADQHSLDISPLTGRLYSGNDGGVYYTSNGGSSWIDISEGLAVAQIYKIGQSAQSRSLVINGYQDNGTAIYDGNWRTEIGGDGMECLIDPTDSTYMYGSLYYGAIRRSSNYGLWFSNIATSISETGEWVTPFILLESDPSTMITGFKNVWKTDNVKASSVSWTKISSNVAGSNSQGIRVLENSPADDNILYYAREDGKLIRSDNIKASTPTYNDMTSNLPTSTWPRDIEAHPTIVNRAYIVQSNKVYQTNTKGGSWTDISSGLPNVSMNCIVYDSSSNGDLYVGSDLGVFFKGSWMTQWIPFSGGLPTAVEVTELEIYYDQDRSKSRIKAATYGRGLWSSQLYGKPSVAFGPDQTQVCVGQVVHFTDSSSGYYHSVLWDFPGGNPPISTAANPNVTYNQSGTYNVKLKVWNDYESDELLKTAYINVDSVPVVSITPSSSSINRGDTVVLTASGASSASVNYTWAPIQGLDKFTGPVVKASPFNTTTYTVTGINPICASSSAQTSVTVTVLQTGINEGNFEGGDLILYPNPVNNEITLDFKGVVSGMKMINLLDASGRIVYTDELALSQSSEVFKFDLSDKPDGLYFLQVIGEKEQLIFKVIIDHSF